MKVVVLKATENKCMVADRSGRVYSIRNKNGSKQGDEMEIKNTRRGVTYAVSALSAVLLVILIALQFQTSLTPLTSTNGGETMEIDDSGTPLGAVGMTQDAPDYTIYIVITVIIAVAAIFLTIIFFATNKRRNE